MEIYLKTCIVSYIKQIKISLNHFYNVSRKLEICFIPGSVGHGSGSARGRGSPVLGSGSARGSEFRASDSVGSFFGKFAFLALRRDLGKMRTHFLYFIANRKICRFPSIKCYTIYRVKWMWYSDLAQKNLMPCVIYGNIRLCPHINRGMFGVI